MKPGSLQPLLKFIRNIAGPAESAATDAQLLHRFVSQRDEEAFAALLHRHGPMVLAVCQRVLRDPHDVEDTFQAVFLVLVRKARSIGRPELLGNWLYGVAHRTALEARGKAIRRQAVEKQVEVAVAALGSEDAVWADLRPVLDEEVAALPEKYRVPFILCYLEGRTNEEAALMMGCPTGTVFSRLAQARKQLRTRLTRRGVALSAGLMATALSENAGGAALPASLVQAVLRVAVGKQIIAGAVSGLAERVINAMYWTKVRLGVAFVLAALSIGTLAGIVTSHAFSPKPPAPRAEQQPGPAQPGVPFFRQELALTDVMDLTGLDFYRFALPDLPGGAKFRVTLSEQTAQEVKARELAHFDFTVDRQGRGTSLRMSFLRLDRRLEGVLLSQEKSAEFRVACPFCSPPSAVAVIENPLHGLPASEKSIVPFGSDKTMGNTQQSPARLLGLYHRKPGQPADVDSAYPRAEVSVVLLPEGK